MAYAIDTRCIHGEGHKNQDGNYAISYPIYQTASFSHLMPGHNPTGFDYSRESNPTRAYPAVQTHSDVPREQREKLGITDTLLRLSVGIENPDDIIADLKQAFENAEK